MSKSCGCLSKEIVSKTHTKNNELFVEDDSVCYGITTNSNEKFYFDKEDLHKVKQFTWFEYNGYIATNNYKLEGYPKLLKLHRLVMDERDSRKFVDHINHDKHDNRKMNLRITTCSQNAMNHKLFKNNSSGVTGVSFCNTEKKWKAAITVNYKKIQLGSFTEFEDAVSARKQAEEKYFGEYSYDSSMKLLEGV